MNDDEIRSCFSDDSIFSDDEQNEIVEFSGEIEETIREKIQSVPIDEATKIIEEHRSKVIDYVRKRKLEKSMTYADLWLNHVANIYRREMLEEMIKAKGENAVKIFQHLEPMKNRFVQAVIGKESSLAGDNICINRLLPILYDKLSDNDQKVLVSRISNTFILGMATQVYLFSSPNRHRCKDVDTESFRNEWEFMTIASDALLEGHGDDNYKFILKIYETNYSANILPFLENNLRLGAWFQAGKRGKIQSFFRNVFFCGMSLVIQCEIQAGKQFGDKTS